MSDEVKMPDPKVEALYMLDKLPRMLGNDCTKWVRSLMARTLWAAAASDQRWETPLGSVVIDVTELERMASEIENEQSK